MIIATALLAGGDQYLKDRIEKDPSLQGKKILKESFVLRKHHNRGFALNKLQEKPGIVKAVSGTMTGFVGIWWIMELITGHKALERAGVSMILAGAISNVIDRFRRGYVVDYVSVNKGKSQKLKRLVFNLGDVSIAAGCILTLLSEIKQ